MMLAGMEGWLVRVRVAALEQTLGRFNLIWPLKLAARVFF